MTEAEKVASLSRSFEAILLRSILENAQKPLLCNDPQANSTSAGIYRDIICNQLAESIARSGTLGLAREFERQLATGTQADTEAAVPDLTALIKRTDPSFEHDLP